MGAKFDKLENKLSGEPGVTDAAGLAAAIGRKKYGKANYDKAAGKDKSPKLKNKGKVKKADEELEKKQGVPAGVDPDKHERCVLDVKADGKDKSSAYAICNASMGKSEVDEEVDMVAKAMEFSTMDPINEIQKTVLELGPEGIKKALPNMTDENKELLNNILEEMNKSHTLPLAAPRKLTNVGGDNYVQEDVSGDEADEAMFEAAVKEGDNEQKHQGGSHDQPYKLDWEGQMIKSLDDFTADELATFGEVYKAMKMKKADKDRHEKDEKYDKKEAAEAYEGRDDAEKKGEKGKAAGYEKEIEADMDDADYDKDRAKVEKAWPAAQQGGSGPSAGAVGAGAAKRLGVKGAGKAKGVFKAEDDKDEMDKAVSASPKLWGTTKPRGVGIYKGDEESVADDVKDVKGPKKLNDVLDDAPEDKKDDILRELREGKMKKAKDMIKAVMKKECPDDMDEGKAELMKNKMKKALIEVLAEEYTDEDIEKAMENMDKGGPGSGKRSAGGSTAMAKERLKAQDKANKKSPVKTISDPDELKRMGYNMKKGWGLEIYPQEDGSWITKAVEMDSVLNMNPGIKKIKQPEVAEESVDTADEALAQLKGEGKMKKSIKYYGEPNDAFKAGRLGRHSYASSVNEYYDAALYKAANPGKEEEMKKSYNKNDINDLIEMNMTTTRVDQETKGRMETFKKSRGSFNCTSFSEDDMIATCHLSKEDVNKL